VLLTLTIGTSLALGVIDIGLKNTITPRGIVSFEFCGFTAFCEAALMEWRDKDQALAMLSLGLDYLYMVLYPGLICVALLMIAPRVAKNTYGITMFAAWLSPAMTLADSIENYALIQVILNGSGDTFGVLAGIFASIKFVILAFTLSWLLFTTLRYVTFGRP
jgi:hypothetical protein